MTVVAKYFFKKGMKSLFHPKRLKLDIKNFKTFFLLKGKWKKIFKQGISRTPTKK